MHFGKQDTEDDKMSQTRLLLDNNNLNNCSLRVFTITFQKITVELFIQ